MSYAIIGCGRVAPNHADGVRQVGAEQLLWACDLDRAKADEMAASFPNARSTTDAAEVLADPRVNAVSICTGHGDHAPLVRAALRASKHVMVEKPFTLSLDEARELIELAHEKKRTLVVVSQHRFDPILRAVKECADAGLFGKLLVASAHLECARDADYYRSSAWRGTWKGEGGSAAINQGYHYVDILCFIAGPVVEARALGATLALGSVIETDDSLVTAMRHDSGVLSTLAVTVGSSVTWRSRVSLMGTRGSVTFDMDFPNTIHLVDGSAELRERLEAAKEEQRREPPPAGLGYYGISHRHQIADFVAAIGNGRRPVWDAEQALVTLRAMASIYAAAGYPWRA